MKDRKDCPFKSGRLVYESGIMTTGELENRYLQTPWPDGFAAFSAGEQRLGAAGDLRRLLAGRRDGTNGPEGYLMEAGLWRNRDCVFEELAIEREGDDFFVQFWRLETGDTGDTGAADHLCYYREADTFVRGNTEIFSGGMPTLEVVVPELRLRFYLTRGAS
jgi:hypothetical protein